ncbi:uncharacterized protein B0P05DRAFT_552333 [Gilbertella persicaria]|uniref:uncharacterized protein n=1 Tax=Gilbertella persicaria TaxID=101096 RepID=UPI00222030E1|nr:uncharacterized protein B0P05DRAFT_552333 [Gilbertella persicaria]KAI8067635.1 hypothetical protein B0P05DRAFT_552333 [Gilbertella persicaria]
MKYSLFISAAYIASVAFAQDAPIISITSPLANTKYKAGQEAIISWINPTVSTIDQIVLAKGSSSALQPIMTIATNVNAGDMKYVWKIPAELESGTEYAFEFGTSPKMAFAGPFTIEGSTGGAVPAAANATTSKTDVNVAAAAPQPAANAASTPNSASPSSNANTSQSSPRMASPTSAGTKHTMNSMVVLGLAATVVSQFF